MAKDNISARKPLSQYTPEELSAAFDTGEVTAEDVNIFLAAKEKIESRVKAEQSRKELLAKRLTNTARLKEEQELRLAAQASCSHLKPNGIPAIGGQRDSKNQTHFLCLNCQKEWLDNALPVHLLNNIDRNNIGGYA